MNDTSSEPLNEGWYVFNGEGRQHKGIDKLGDPPPWRGLPKGAAVKLAAESETSSPEDLRSIRSCEKADLEAVNAALHLRRPLLLSGRPGTGKSTLARAIAWELRLGPVLEWPVNSKSTRQQGLYEYDAMGRLYDSQTAKGKEAVEPSIGKYIRLGALGTALASKDRPRVVLVDEMDKSDYDLANDLLNVLEEAKFTIPELMRRPGGASEVVVDSWDGEPIEVPSNGIIECAHYPIIIFTSNEDREFPPAFLRRCIRHRLQEPKTKEALERILRTKMSSLPSGYSRVVEEFIKKENDDEQLSNDQLLNAIFILRHIQDQSSDPIELAKKLLQNLNGSPEGFGSSAHN